MKKMIVLSESWDHMASHSGFAGLTSALGTANNNVVALSQSNIPRLFRYASRSRHSINTLCRTQKKTNQSPSPFPTAGRELLCEYALALKCLSRHSFVVLTSAESQFGEIFANASLATLHATIAVFHQPPSWLKLHWRDNTFFSKLGQIIVLSRDQKEYIQHYTDCPIHLIRHGVDLDFFKPSLAVSPNQNLELLFVGQWLRDFELLEKTFEALNAQLPSIHLRCVLPRQSRYRESLFHLAKHANVHFYADISAEELRGLYQQADLLYLPLVDATANNSLVEALACGLPVVISDIGGVRDYIFPDFGQLVADRDPRTHASIIAQWLNDPRKREYASLAARTFAEQNLDWSQIAEDLLGQVRTSA
jgi:glycosyltransferase involved in cell wall biosynthesis